MLSEELSGTSKNILSNGSFFVVEIELGVDRQFYVIILFAIWRLLYLNRMRRKRRETDN